MNTQTQHYIPILSISGSNPSGETGIQQDLKTCTELGCYGMAAITLLTAQSPSHIKRVHKTSEFLEAQLTALLEEVRPLAVKIGMVSDIKTVETIADAIMKYRLENIVVDPVIATTSGHIYSESSTVAIMKELLFPLATIITPNVQELEDLHSQPIVFPEDARIAAKEISDEYGCDAVLVKGGHANWNDDILYLSDLDCYAYFRTTHINSPNTHGTGCRLSTAIACQLAKGHPIEIAVREAKEWLTDDIRHNALMRLPKPIISKL